MDRKGTKLISAVALTLALTSLGCANLLTKFKEAVEAYKLEGVVDTRAMERSPQTVKKVLPNGMTVIVAENFGAPVAAVQVWANVGSADETDEEAGIAHLIEHMVFKGTAKRGVGQTAMEVESLGGDLNAFTSYDHTVFHITLASRFFDRAVEILSDLVLTPRFDQAELDREREVVLEEVRRGKDNPSSRIYKYLFEEAYDVHAYRRPVIGYEETVSGFQREDLVRFYERYYQPENLTVIVTGNVRAGDAIKEIERYFSAAAPGAAPAWGDRPRAKEEPAQTAARAQVYREDVNDGYLYLGFHIGDFNDADMPALDVLGVILGGGETSRLTYRVRAERRLVNKIWAYAYTPRDDGMFLVGTNLEEDKAPQAVEMILKQLYLLKHEPVEDWELDKAKLTLETEGIYARETVDGQARRLGYFHSFTGDTEFEKSYLEKVRRTTPEDIQRVVSKYMKGGNLSLVAILPEKGKSGGFDKARAHRIIEDADKWDQSYQSGELVEPEPITPPEIPVAEPTPATQNPGLAAKPPVKFDFKNGIKLIVRENHGVPLVAVHAVFDGGLRRENSRNNGINNFISELITKGTVHYSASDIHSMIESRAGSISGFSGRNATGVNLEVPSPFFYSTLPLFAEVVRYPTFPEDEVERARGIIISDIRAQLDQPQALAHQLFRSELFREHPYGMDIKGTEKSVESLSREDLINYYQGFAMPDNLVIAVVGDVKADEVRAAFENMFKDWVSEGYRPGQVEIEPAPVEPRRAEECKDVNQTNLVIGFRGATVTSSDRHGIEVMSSVLSGMSGRLFANLRGKQSLAYSVYAFSIEGVDPGLLGVYIGTSPDKEKTAAEGILKELERIAGEPVTKEELKRAKEVLVGDFEIQLQRYGNQALHYALDELYGLGFRASEHYAEKVQAVTVEDVKSVAGKYLKLEAPVTAVVKPCNPLARN